MHTNLRSAIHTIVKIYSALSASPGELPEGNLFTFNFDYVVSPVLILKNYQEEYD